MMDMDQAIDWYKDAAEHGSAKAQFALGLCYAKGQGVEHDYEKAIKLFEKAQQVLDEINSFLREQKSADQK